MDKEYFEKDVTFIGKFYLKNGVVIEDKIIFDKNDTKHTKEEIKEFMGDFKESIKNEFKYNDNNLGYFTFGFTTIKVSELVAFTIIKEEE